MEGLKNVLRRWLSPQSTAGWLLRGLSHHPLTFPLTMARSLVATHKLTGRPFPVRVRLDAHQRLRVNIHQEATVRIKGLLLVNSWGGSNLASSIYCGPGASLEIDGDFEIGPNVHLQVVSAGKLHIGGRREATASGITCDTRIMVEQSVTIGADCIIAWDVYISDSDWHDIEGTLRCRPVSIGQHVWIGHGVSVLKGSTIPAGSIVGAKSVVRTVVQGDCPLIAGTPAKVLKNHLKWKR